MTEPGDTIECECGNVVTVDDGGWALCFGAPPESPHGKTVLARPCVGCDTPIRTAELCDDCAPDLGGFPDEPVDPSYLPPIPRRRGGR